MGEYERESGKTQDARWQRYVHEIRQGKPPSFSDQLTVFNNIFSGRRDTDGPPHVWQPDKKHLADSNISVLMKETGFTDYREFQRWSAAHRAEFWGRVITHLNILFVKKPAKILDTESDVRDPGWLPGARLNCTESCFQADPDQTAIISAGEGSVDLVKTSYQDLENMVNRVAGGLKKLGFQNGDRVALYMPMNTACVSAYLGIIRAGCQVVSIADSFSAVELKKRLQLAETKWVITVDFYRRAGHVIRPYDKIREDSDCRAIVIAGEGGSVLRKDDLHWDNFLSADTSFTPQAGEPYTITNILFSSGTTGTPKIIPWTQLTPVKAAMDGCFHQDIHAGDVVAWPTNIGWMMGPWLIYAALINKATIALFEGAPQERGFIRFVREADVSMLGVIPSLVRAWRRAELVSESEWDQINCFSSTGEPSHFEDYLWLMSRTAYRAPVIEYLGGTEIGGGHITGSIVRPACPALFNTPALGIDFVLLDEKGKPVPDGKEGELYLIPPSIGLSQTLLNKDHQQIYYANCPPGPDGRILRRHGDRFLKYADSFYKAQGRSDDTMNLGGIKVSSVELERTLEVHPDIRENAAVSVQTAGEGQEKLIIFAVSDKAPDVKRLKNELNVLLARNLNPLFKLADLVLVDRLPRTASNKLQRRKLRAAYLQTHNSNGASHENQS